MKALPVITKDEEIRDLKRMNQKIKGELDKAIEQLINGEWHHRAFEKRCARPDEVKEESR